MYRLEKFHLIQFFLCSAETLHFGASTGIVAPNGSGKSAMLDAMQIVLHGGDRHAIDLNAQSGGARGADGRSIREYCLGFYRGDEHVREHATTYLTMVFRDSTGKLPPVSVGIALGASINDPKLRIYGWYILSGAELTIEDHMETLANGEQLPVEWAKFKAMAAEKAQLAGGKLELPKTAFEHVQTMLFRLRPNGSQYLSVAAFTKGLKNALNLQTVKDASVFVRDFIVEARPIDLKIFREQLDTFRTLKSKVQEVIGRIAKIEGMREKNTKALHARMREITYKAMIAEFQRDLHMEERYEAEDAMQKADVACVQDRNKALMAEQAFTNADKEFTELNKQANSDPRFAAAKNMQLESENALTPIKRNLATELRRIVAAYASGNQRDAGIGGWSFLSKPWEQLLDAVQSTAAGIALKVDIDSILAQLQQVTSKTRPLLDKIKHVEAEDAKCFKDLELDFKVASDQLKRAQEGKSPLIDHPALIIQRLLAEQGIDSTLVCDVVTITDSSWAAAIEAFLGRKNIAALLIEPGRLNDALRVYEKIPASYNPFDVLIVKPRRRPVEQTSLPDKSLANLIQGSNPQAVDFIRSRLQKLVQLEKATSDSPDGLTREGMLVSRDSYGRRRPMAASGLVLGYQDQRVQADLLARKKKEISEKLSEAQHKARRSKDLIEAITPLQSLEGKLEDIDRWLHEHADKQRELETQAAMTKLIDSPDLIARLQLLEAAKENRGVAQKTMLQTREALGAQEQVVRTVRERFENLANRTDTIVHAAMEAMKLPHVDAAWLEKKHGEMEAAGKSLVGMIQACHEGSGRSAKLFGEHGATVRAELNQYATAYPFDIVIDTSDPDAVKKILDEEAIRLVDSELHTYERQAEDAYHTSVSTFRSRIAASLRNSFDDMFGQLRDLNSTMSALPPFTNNEKYRFKYAVNPDNQALYNFIRAAAEAGPENELFTDPLKVPDDFRLMLEGKDAATAMLMEDYRRFFNFEIEVLHNGIKVDIFKKRMDKGSGGEHRAPLFIVAGAALAAAYGKLQGDTSGMSLILFDELGDKIDSTNTRAVFDFLISLGLQPIVAAPEDALSKISESVDGYIEMYRDEDVLAIKHVGLGPDARTLLNSDNFYLHPELLEEEIRKVERDRGAQT